MNDLVDNSQELLDVDRFGQVSVCSRCHVPLQLASCRVCADDDDRNMSRLPVCLQPGEHLISVQVGQAEVQEDEIGLMSGCQQDAKRSLHSADQGNVRPQLHRFFEQHEVGRVVLDAENLSPTPSTVTTSRYPRTCPMRK